MFELLKKLENANNANQRRELTKRKESGASSIKSTKTSRSKTSVASIKSKLIRKQRVEHLLEKLKMQLEEKIERTERKINEIVLEESSVSESPGENSMDDWRESIDPQHFEENNKLARSAEMAPIKHPMVIKMPNELVDEELPS